MRHVKLFESESKPYRRIGGHPNASVDKLGPEEADWAKAIFGKLGIAVVDDGEQREWIYEAFSFPLAGSVVDNEVEFVFQRQFRQFKGQRNPVPVLWVLLNRIEDDYFLVSLTVVDYDFSRDSHISHCELHFKCDGWHGLTEFVEGPITEIVGTVIETVKMQQEVEKKTRSMKKGLSAVGGRPS